MTKRTVMSLINSVANLSLNGPDGEPLKLDDGTPVVIRVQSVDNKSVKHKSLEAMATLNNAQKKADDATGWANALMKAEQAIRDVASTAVIGWDSTFDEFLGSSYTAEYVKQLLDQPSMLFIARQVCAFTQKAEAFFA
jgi:hypothetical protein